MIPIYFYSYKHVPSFLPREEMRSIHHNHEHFLPVCDCDCHPSPPPHRTNTSLTKSPKGRQVQRRDKSITISLCVPLYCLFPFKKHSPSLKAILKGLCRLITQRALRWCSKGRQSTKDLLLTSLFLFYRERGSSSDYIPDVLGNGDAILHSISCCKEWEGCLWSQEREGSPRDRPEIQRKQDGIDGIGHLGRLFLPEPKFGVGREREKEKRKKE